LLARIACLPISAGAPTPSRIASSVQKSVSATGSRDTLVERSVYAMHNVVALRRQAETAGEAIGRYADALSIA
jgi:hypothetical protein